MARTAITGINKRPQLYLTELRVTLLPSSLCGLCRIWMILRLNRALLVAFHAPIVVLLLVTLYSVLRSLFRLGLALSLSIFLHIHLFYSLLRFRPNRTDPFVLSCVI